MDDQRKCLEGGWKPTNEIRSSVCLPHVIGSVGKLMSIDEFFRHRKQLVRHGTQVMKRTVVFFFPIPIDFRHPYKNASATNRSDGFVRVDQLPSTTRNPWMNVLATNRILSTTSLILIVSSISETMDNPRLSKRKIFPCQTSQLSPTA